MATIKLCWMTYVLKVLRADCRFQLIELTSFIMLIVIVLNVVDGVLSLPSVKLQFTDQ